MEHLCSASAVRSHLHYDSFNRPVGSDMRAARPTIYTNTLCDMRPEVRGSKPNMYLLLIFYLCTYV